MIISLDDCEPGNEVIGECISCCPSKIRPGYYDVTFRIIDDASTLDFNKVLRENMIETDTQQP